MWWSGSRRVGVCRCLCMLCDVVVQMGLGGLCWVGVFVGGMWDVVGVLSGMWMGGCGLWSGFGSVLG